MENMTENVYKDLLIYWHSEFPNAHFIDGVVLGTLLAQDYSKFNTWITYMKSVLKIMESMPFNIETRAETLASYIETLFAKIRKESQFKPWISNLSKHLNPVENPHKRRRLKEDWKQEVEECKSNSVEPMKIDQVCAPVCPVSKPQRYTIQNRK